MSRRRDRRRRTRLHPLRRPRRRTTPKPDGLARLRVMIDGHLPVVCVMAGTYRYRQGLARAGATTATRPNPGRFTSETGRATIQRVWRTKWRHIARIGTRIGRALMYRPRINKAALRRRYAEDAARMALGQVAYTPTGWQILESAGPRTLSERAALTRLGHLSTYKPKTGVHPTARDIVVATYGRTARQMHARRRTSRKDQQS